MTLSTYYAARIAEYGPLSLSYSRHSIQKCTVVADRVMARACAHFACVPIRPTLLDDGLCRSLVPT